MTDLIIVNCGQCRYYEPALVGENSDCTQWDSQIKRGVSVQQNALFYREQLGGDSLYSNCEFLADEVRVCKRFAGSYAFITGD